MEKIIGIKKPVPLTEREPALLLDRQLARFDRKSIHAVRLMEFDPATALERLKAKEGQKVIGADFGGDKGVTQLFVVRDGVLVASDEFKDRVESDDSSGYMESLERTAEFARSHNIPVGVSWGTPLDGSKPLTSTPKSKVFIEALGQKYGGDFAELLPTLAACMNDGPAGIVSGAIEANRLKPTSSVLLPINGSGIGMAVLHEGTIFATEAGHVEGEPEFNQYNQSTECGLFGATYVCLENLGANKCGIETQWKLLTGEAISAKEIEGLYKEGDELARELYEHSAVVLAHVIAGTAQAFDINLADNQTTIVGHGGAFKFPHYGERVQQILTKFLHAEPAFIMTKDYGDPNSNACLDGAALAAVTAS